MLKGNDSSQGSQREKRKYTKHDYFADLERELPSWKVCYSVLRNVGKFYQKRDLYMPRFYAKKEVFSQTGNELELTSNKDKRPTENIWVLVRRGSKRTQNNDIDMAEKVYFKNDGRPHRGQVSVNDLGWKKVDIISTPKIPVLSILNNQGRLN